jgi:hypothetical protein
VNGLGSAVPENLARTVRDGLAVFVDQFITAYLAANPQK